MTNILLVDDSATMLMSLKGALEINGFQVATASDGVKAIQVLQSGVKPDLIITDINMPNMNGLEFIQKARTMLRFTPILALTTESQQAKRDEAKKLGASGWLVKPVSSADLIAVIKKLVPGA